MEDKKCYIGIDPGKSGFITIFDGNEFSFIEMPTHKVETGDFLKNGKPKLKKEFNEKGFREIILDLSKTYKGYEKFVCIEEVGGRGGWSATNNFNFGYVAGLQRMIPIMLGCEYISVRPAKWQSYMRMGYDLLKKSSSSGKTQVNDSKAIAEMIVKKEYPNIDFRKTSGSRKNDDNKIDSFLICLYLYRIMNK